ncbi:TPR repeat-containing protein [Oscillatoria nigro-viridis PCC 7112]|uniref:TPR repeat-containing protein n=1 Tax=Phormidium nigroviride PCC 7112 TaxID=179408 RepID=K9VBF6_9CYAN|nr:tetratricopeptide repeat protein [Oscillatoria nigro-viridis]AFZ05191.1 TPR repeat-containing protein [Oscillatoria nigro-viridis PCC 7112]
MQNLMFREGMPNRGNQILRMRSSVPIGCLLFLWLCAGSIASAQTNPPGLDQFSPNPLEITTPDPLAPANESLSSTQRDELTAALEELNLEALAKLEAGDGAGAFEIWFRELRLRRYLGPAAEIAALSRVGSVAWSNGKNLELQLITKRLQAIQKQVKSQVPLNTELLPAFAAAFQQVRAKGPTVEVYQEILENARQNQDILAQGQILKAIGLIHINWLSYDKAAPVYEELATLIQENRALFAANSAVQNSAVVAGNGAPPQPVTPPTEVETLRQLAYVYQQSKQPLKAIAAREKLASVYLNLQNPSAIPPLKIAIASDYQTIGQINLAAQYYQEAYNLAVPIQQYAQASEALDKLALLYRAQKQWEPTLRIYQMQLLLEERAYNFYGLMSAYDNLGQVYQEMKAYDKALESYQKGLDVAKKLGHRQEYFAKKIQKVNKQLQRTS